jgi:hypothetical protein
VNSGTVSGGRRAKWISAETLGKRRRAGRPRHWGRNPFQREISASLPEFKLQLASSRAW